jgi:predicted glycogen debranching enzyme
MALNVALTAEWLETDGRGGFASGTVGGWRTRRYHAWLLMVHPSSGERYALINGAEVVIATAAGTFLLSCQEFENTPLQAESVPWLEDFQSDPWPRWRWRLPDGTCVEQELLVLRRGSECLVRWRLVAGDHAELRVKFLFSGRSLHALHHENAAFDFTPTHEDGWMCWSPYVGVPRTCILSRQAEFTPEPQWYRRFFYAEEAVRGFPAVEDLAVPGVWTAVLTKKRGVAEFVLADTPTAAWEQHYQGELSRRQAFTSPWQKAAEDYLIRRRDGKPTIIAGYPWFTDWGRDTFISLHGLCLSSGKHRLAEEILLNWSHWEKDGLLPNRFPDFGEVPEYHSVDAALWFIIAADRSSKPMEEALRHTVLRIVEQFRRGTHFGIRMDSDGLLTCGEEGLQLTWMDAKIGDWVVTPRRGKPVEIQALWINALQIASRFQPDLAKLVEQASDAFVARFWLEEGGYLADVVDELDISLRPNQLFALGGLPKVLLPKAKAARALAAVERHLLTPLGLRTLAPYDPQYRPTYAGGPVARDGAYHQGTVWPWLLGAYWDAWKHLHPYAEHAAKLAELLAPLRLHRLQHGLGHISEIADATSPHQPNGCPFQAWSVAEYIRLEQESCFTYLCGNGDSHS